MRVLHVVHQYVPDHVAGTELYTQAVAQRQFIAGLEVAIFTPLNRVGAALPEAVEEEGVRVYRVPAGKRTATGVFRSTFRHDGLAAAFNAVLERERPDIVHLQHLMGVPAATGRQLLAADIPYLISLHDYWYGCANGQLLTNDTEKICGGPDTRFHNCGRCAAARAGLVRIARVVGPLASPIMRQRYDLLKTIFAGARRVLAPNEFVCRAYEAMGFPTGHVTINPLGLDAPPDLARRVAGRRPAHRAVPLRLGYIGSISRQKGVHILIEAVNTLAPDVVTLDVYGDSGVFPAYASELRALARHPGIRFKGVVSRDQIWDVLAGLDVLVMPTLWYEASPAIIREAFAAGLPVVASALGAPGSMIRDGIDGLLFPAGDAAALASVLGGLARRPERIGELRAGITQVRTITEHVAAINRLYSEVLAENSAMGGAAR